MYSFYSGSIMRPIILREFLCHDQLFSSCLILFSLRVIRASIAKQKQIILKIQNYYKKSQIILRFLILCGRLLFGFPVWLPMSQRWNFRVVCQAIPAKQKRRLANSLPFDLILRKGRDQLNLAFHSAWVVGIEQSDFAGNFSFLHKCQ